MDVFSTIAALRLAGSITLAAAIVCLAAILALTFKTTPSQLKQIIQEEERRRDPKHRKPVVVCDPKEEDIKKMLFHAPDVSMYAGWHGCFLGKGLSE